MNDRIQLTALSKYYFFLRHIEEVDRIFKPLLKYGSQGK